MLADYINNPLMLKWYEVAHTQERNLFKKVDAFVYLSMKLDNAFDLVYVSIDNINRRMTRCYHGKIVVKLKNNYLIIRQGLWRKKFLIVAQNDDASMVALSNKRKSKVCVLSNKLPFDKTEFEKVIGDAEKQGIDVSNIEMFYE